MTTMTTSTPTAAELAATFAVVPDEDLEHLVRFCDPDTALCGEHVPGEEFTDPDEAAPRCPECVAIDRTGDAVHVAGCVTCREGDW